MADSPAHMSDFTVDVLDTMIVEQAYRRSSSVPIISTDTPLSEMQELFSEREENYFPVVSNQKKIVGIISLRTARSVMFEGKVRHLLIAQDLMSKAVTVTPAESLRSALKKFIDFDYGQIPVVDFRDERKILGLISHEDIIDAYNREIKRRKLSV